MAGLALSLDDLASVPTADYETIQRITDAALGHQDRPGWLAYLLTAARSPDIEEVLMTHAQIQINNVIRHHALSSNPPAWFEDGVENVSMQIVDIMLAHQYGNLRHMREAIGHCQRVLTVHNLILVNRAIELCAADDVRSQCVGGLVLCEWVDLCHAFWSRAMGDEGVAAMLPRVGCVVSGLIMRGGCVSEACLRGLRQLWRMGALEPTLEQIECLAVLLQSESALMQRRGVRALHELNAGAWGPSRGHRWMRDAFAAIWREVGPSLILRYVAPLLSSDSRSTVVGGITLLADVAEVEAVDPALVAFALAMGSRLTKEDVEEADSAPSAFLGYCHDLSDYVANHRSPRYAAFRLVRAVAAVRGPAAVGRGDWVAVEADVFLQRCWAKAQRQAWAAGRRPCVLSAAVDSLLSLLMLGEAPTFLAVGVLYWAATVWSETDHRRGVEVGLWGIAHLRSPVACYGAARLLVRCVRKARVAPPALPIAGGALLGRLLSCASQVPGRAIPDAVVMLIRNLGAEARAFVPEAVVGLLRLSEGFLAAGEVDAALSPLGDAAVLAAEQEGDVATTTVELTIAGVWALFAQYWQTRAGEAVLRVVEALVQSCCGEHPACVEMLSFLLRDEEWFPLYAAQIALIGSRVVLGAKEAAVSLLNAIGRFAWVVVSSEDESVYEGDRAAALSLVGVAISVLGPIALPLAEVACWVWRVLVSPGGFEEALFAAALTALAPALLVRGGLAGALDPESFRAIVLLVAAEAPVLCSSARDLKAACIVLSEGVALGITEVLDSLLEAAALVEGRDSAGPAVAWSVPHIPLDDVNVERQTRAAVASAGLLGAAPP